MDGTELTKNLGVATGCNVITAPHAMRGGYPFNGSFGLNTANESFCIDKKSGEPLNVFKLYSKDTQNVSAIFNLSITPSNVRFNKPILPISPFINLFHRKRTTL